MNGPSEERYRDRVRPLVSLIEESGADLLWVSNRLNIRYLTGFTGSSAELLVSPSESLFITDGRYQEQVQSEVKGCRIRIFQSGPWTEVLREEIGNHGWKTIAFESDHVSYATLEKLQSLPDLSGPIRWEPIRSWVEGLRSIKDEDELDALQRSSQVVDEVYRALLPEFREGVTEREILRRMMNLFWERGATGPSFDPIVLFGARSSLPHGQPGETTLRKGDWVLLDFGAVVDGYCSDCTRTFVFGEPETVQRERHELVKKAHQTGIAAAYPGVSCKQVDARAREVINEAGLGEAFIHGLGHGVGLEIHEAPRVAKVSEDILREGMVVTIEPGVYLSGWGGIRIEDAVVIHAEGAEPLTRCDHSIQPF